MSIFDTAEDILNQISRISAEKRKSWKTQIYALTEEAVREITKDRPARERAVMIYQLSKKVEGVKLNHPKKSNMFVCLEILQTAMVRSSDQMRGKFWRFGLDRKDLECPSR